MLLLTIQDKGQLQSFFDYLDTKMNVQDEWRIVYKSSNNKLIEELTNNGKYPLKADSKMLYFRLSDFLIQNPIKFIDLEVDLYQAFMDINEHYDINSHGSQDYLLAFFKYMHHFAVLYKSSSNFFIDYEEFFGFKDVYKTSSINKGDGFKLITTFNESPTPVVKSPDSAIFCKIMLRSFNKRGEGFNSKIKPRKVLF